MWPQCNRQLGGQVENHCMLHHSGTRHRTTGTHWIPASMFIHMYVYCAAYHTTYVRTWHRPWQGTYKEWCTQPPMHAMFRCHGVYCMQEQEEGVATCRRQGDQSLHLVTRCFNLGTTVALINPQTPFTWTKKCGSNLGRIHESNPDSTRITSFTCASWPQIQKWVEHC